MPSNSHFFSEKREAIAAFSIAILFCALAGAAAGASLGLAFAGLFAAAIVLPPLTAGSVDFSHGLVIAIAGVGGISASYLALTGPSAATLAQWFCLCLIVLSLAISLLGLVQFLRRVGLAPLSASAITVFFALAWLTWPIWLSRPLADLGCDRLLALLVWIHPPLAANGILVFTSPWTEQTIAYRMSVLNQDIPIQLPSTALPCVSAHFLAGAAFFLCSFFWKSTPRPTSPAAA